MNNIRREKMLKFIEEKEIVTLDELSAQSPEVSLMTIHRDLTFLQDQGLIVKVRGGARYIASGTSEPAFTAREIINQPEKQAIAAKAARLLAGCNSIFIDAGTTMMAFAKQISDHPMSITTTGPNIALELAQNPNLIINLCGGVLNKSNLTLSGSAAMRAIAEINIDTAFLVTSGYSAASGFTCGNEGEARIKTMVAAQARNVVMLLDTSKMEHMLPYTFARMGDFSYIVTEREPSGLPEDFQRAANEAGVSIL